MYPVDRPGGRAGDQEGDGRWPRGQRAESTDCEEVFSFYSESSGKPMEGLDRSGIRHFPVYENR